MTVQPERPRPRPRPRPRRSAPGRVWLVRLLAATLIFLLGLAVGRALEDAGDGSGSVTQVRTLKPLTIRPEPETVTLTVTP